MKAKVNNFLTTDPYHKRGEIGEVLEISNGIAKLKFADGVIGFYEIDTLEILN
ncbi:hypothetical protein ACQ1QE_04700 [Ornithobacterium rhinotracheale]